MNNSTSDVDAGRIIQWTISVPAFVFGLPLNLAALWLILFRIRRWTSSVVYLTSLIVNDCLLIFSLPFKMYAYNNSNWELSRGFCTFLESLVYVNIYGSIMLTVCISSDRFISLQFPFTYNTLCSPHRAALVSLVVWVLVFISTTPVHKLHDDNSNSTNMFCFQTFSDSTWDKLWLIILMETVFFVCTVTMLFFSVRVMQILRKLRNRNPLDDKLRDNKSVKIVLSNLIAFLVCFIPYHVMALVYFLLKHKDFEDTNVITYMRQVVHISTSLTSINCLTDGMCYYHILNESQLFAKKERRRMSTRGTIVRNSSDTLTEQRKMELEKLNAAHQT